MPQSKALHHMQIRKRIHKKKEKYPSQDKFKRFFDNAVMLVGILTVFLTIPQAVKIFMEQTAAGVSFLTWFAFTIGALFWLGYGILHKEKPIIITYAGFFIVDLIIIMGAIIYG